MGIAWKQDLGAVRLTGGFVSWVTIIFLIGWFPVSTFLKWPVAFIRGVASLMVRLKHYEIAWKDLVDHVRSSDPAAIPPVRVGLGVSQTRQQLRFRPSR